MRDMNAEIESYTLPGVTVSCSFGDGEKLGFLITREEILDNLLDVRMAAGLETLRRAVAVRTLKLD